RGPAPPRPRPRLRPDLSRPCRRDGRPPPPNAYVSAPAWGEGRRRPPQGEQDVVLHHQQDMDALTRAPTGGRGDGRPGPARIHRSEAETGRAVPVGDLAPQPLSLGVC